VFCKGATRVDQGGAWLTESASEAAAVVADLLGLGFLAPFADALVEGTFVLSKFVC
jgi:hypothetical protein